MNEVGFLLAFWGGLLSFFSPCIFPLLPVYFAYLTGAGPQKIGQKNYALLEGVLFFVLGLSSILFIEGFLAGSIGSFLFSYRRALQIGFGIFIFLMGFLLLGVIPLPFLYRDRGALPSLKFNLSPVWSGLLLGVAFSFTWTPCSGPVLASILGLATSSGRPLLGGFLLFVYSLGFALPFVLIAIFFHRALGFLKKAEKTLRVIQIVSAFLFMGLGVLLALGYF